MDGNSSGEEDYMSDVLLSSMKDVRPGINAESRAQRRFILIETNRRIAQAAEESRKPMKKAEMERSRLEEGLSQPICDSSKGFSLLSKMGYKPGMSLGRKREGELEGIKEPIAIPLKASKKGLGHEAEEAERQKERCEMHLTQMKNCAKAEKMIVEDFRVRKRFAAVQKRLISDLHKARKTCEELDIRLERDVPHQVWFWPIHRRVKEESEFTVGEMASTSNASIINRNAKRSPNFGRNSTENGNTNNGKEVEFEFLYANGNIAPEELSYAEWGEAALEDSLNEITSYVREAHNYCIWCGCAYSSPQDLVENCPGVTRQDHDGDDEGGDGD